MIFGRLHTSFSFLKFERIVFKITERKCHSHRMLSWQHTDTQCHYHWMLAKFLDSSLSVSDLNFKRVESGGSYAPFTQEYITLI